MSALPLSTSPRTSVLDAFATVVAAAAIGLVWWAPGARPAPEVAGLVCRIGDRVSYDQVQAARERARAADAAWRRAAGPGYFAAKSGWGPGSDGYATAERAARQRDAAYAALERLCAKP